MPNTHPSSSRYRYTKRRYRILFRALDEICSPLFRFVQRSDKPLWADPRSILVVQLDHIGDAVLTTPLLKALKERFPCAALDVLASHANHEIFRTSPWVHAVHESRRNWHARLPEQRSWLPEVMRLVRQLRRCRYDLAIDPRGDFLVTLILWLAAIPRRVGWECGGGGFMLTDIAPWDATRHELNSRQILLGMLGIRPPPAQFRPEVFPSWADIYQVRERLQAIPHLRSPVTIFHVGAGTAAKRWPAESWSRLAHQLRGELRGSIILVGTASDLPTARKVARSNPHIVDWTGHLTLMQTAALVREADLFVGCDSGPAHIAAALGIPSVVLFSGTNRDECWRPVGECVRVLRRPAPCAPCHLRSCPIANHPCMTGISEHAVLGAVRELVEQQQGLGAAFGNLRQVQGRHKGGSHAEKQMMR